MLRFNPLAKIIAHHKSIFDSQFDISWFAGFALVLTALDNATARSQVNLMCVAAGIPCVESGTAGYHGQVAIHKKSLFSCFDCFPRTPPKTYPVCTIRSTPSEPIHCIVWAKSYLFAHLFGDNEGEESLNTESVPVTEVDRLKNEAADLKRIKASIGLPEAARLAFEKVFYHDIKKLLEMEDLWKVRAKPIPLKWDVIQKDAQKLNLGDIESLDHDQNVWCLAKNLKMFTSSLKSLSKQIIARREVDPTDFLVFDKDDEESLNFVTASSNIRAHIFHIKNESRFTVKEMAGNVIPAIATTNAIVAGLMVSLAVKVINNQMDRCQATFVTYGGVRTHVLVNENPPTPNINCAVCSSGYLTLRVDVSSFTLKNILHEVIGSGDKQGLDIQGEVSIQDGDRLLYDVELEDNLNSTLKDLGVVHGSKLTVINDYDEDATKNICIIIFIHQRLIQIYHSDTMNSFELTGNRKIGPRPIPVAEIPEVNKKRTHDEGETDAKRQKLDIIDVDGEESILIED